MCAVYIRETIFYKRRGRKRNRPSNPSVEVGAREPLKPPLLAFLGKFEVPAKSSKKQTETPFARDGQKRLSQSGILTKRRRPRVHVPRQEGREERKIEREREKRKQKSKGREKKGRQKETRRRQKEVKTDRTLASRFRRIGCGPQGVAPSHARVS